jgi:MFS family permease
MNGFGLARERFALLFAVMLVAAAGNTAMQSLLPAIGRELGVADIWVAIAFSLSAVLWVAMAPVWARRADRRGRRALMRLGLTGFIASNLICGFILAAGLAGLAAPTLVFTVFMIGRGLYGTFGSASPPAVQAYVAARTDGAARTSAMATLASSFGLGTIIGPAIAPLFVFAPLGLSGPLFVFAGIAALVLALLVLRLPDDTPRNPARGQIVAYPSIGGTDAGPQGEDPEATPLRWRDPRVVPWHVVGIVGNHGQAALLGVIGFLVIDRLHVPLAHAQESIAIVLMSGAVAALLAQWGLIPRLRLTPRELVLWGAGLAGAGVMVTGVSHGIYGITLGFALASLGFGLFRPGFTSGASLAVARHEQNAVAGMVTSVNGLAYIAGAPLAVAVYQLGAVLPFAGVTVLMLGLALWTAWKISPSAPAE